MVKALAAIVLGGCSFALVHPPATAHDESCTAQLEAPIADTVISGLAVATLGAAAVDASVQGSRACVDCGSPWYGVEGVAFFTVPVALIYGFSAAYGWVGRHACQQVSRGSAPVANAARR